MDSLARGEKHELQPSRTLVTQTLKENEKQFELAGIRVIEVNFIESLIRERKFFSLYASSNYRGSTVSSRIHIFLFSYTAISRKVVGKICTRQSRKVIWDMINTLFLAL